MWQVMVSGVVVVSLILMAARVVRLARQPIHLRWELAPLPHAPDGAGPGGSRLEQSEWWTKPRQRARAAALLHIAREILLFRQVWTRNREILLFPVFSGLALLLILLSFAVPVVALGGAETVQRIARHNGVVGNGVVLFAFYFPESSDKHLRELFGRLNRSEKPFGA